MPSRDIATGDVGWDHLERLVDAGVRMAGTDGERRAAEATREALADHARDARVEEFPVTRWRRGDAAIETDDGSADCIGLPRSPADAATGELVDVDHGIPGDFEGDLEGAVVLADAATPDWFDRGVHRREKYYRAVDAGAAAFVYRHATPGCLAPTGSVGGREGPLGPIPAVGVSHETGARLARRHAGEAVTVRVDADVEESTSRNVHAVLGPETETELLVTSHLDAHDIAEGAMDNGAGTAMLVELAAALDAEDLGVRVRFVAFGAEEVGLLGSGHEAETADLDDVRAVVNLDGVLQSRDVAVTTHGFDPLAETLRSVADRLGHPVEVNPQMGPHSDHWPFVTRGVPGCHVHAAAEGRGWGHTAADTLDKLDVRDMREQALLLGEYVVALADPEFAVAHVDPADVAEACERQGVAEALRATDDWPF